jgi:hypothetical protein
MVKKVKQADSGYNAVADEDGVSGEYTPPEQVITEPTRQKPVPELVEMTDGRKIEFAGRIRMDKTILIDEDAGTVAVRFDFRNGQTATYQVPQQHLLYAAGHGWAQKLGDHVAGMKDEATKEPASEEDMFLAIESLVNDLNTGGWNKVRSGEGTVSGAGIVLRAVAQHFGKPVAVVKEILEAKLAEDKARGGTLSRKALYASFRNPDTELGQLILAMEADKKKPAAPVDVSGIFDTLAA